MIVLPSPKEKNIMIDLEAHIKESLEHSYYEVSKIPETVYNIPGLTSNKVRCFLNNICTIKNICYLELGVYRGATFCSAIYGNTLNAVGVDNWSSPVLKPFRSDMWTEWDESVTRGDPKEEFLKNVKKFKGTNDVSAYDANYWDFDLKQLKTNIDVLFYDGEHKYRDQYQMLTNFYNDFSDKFILIIDDWNWEQGGIFDAIDDLNLLVSFDKQIYTTGEDPQDYWNGLGIFLLEKNDRRSV